MSTTMTDTSERRRAARPSAKRRRKKKSQIARPPRLPDLAKSLNILVRRLQEKIAKLNTNARAVSRAAGLADTYVHDVLTGRNEKPSILATQKIAKALGTTLAFLTGEIDDKSEPEIEVMDEMPVLATAEVNTARPVAPTDPTYTMVSGQRSRRYPNAVHFAVRIADDCMNKPHEGALPLLRGMTALCIDMKQAGLIVESGHIYVVRRTLDAGRTWETLVRRAEVYRDRTILFADSLTPKHAMPIVVTRAVPVVAALPWKNTGQSAICVFGLVYGAQFSRE